MFLNPHVPKAHQYKVQLHCHTTESDGKWTPTAVVAEYDRLGFDVLAITDHDALTTEPTPDPGGHSLLFLRSIEETFRVVSFPERSIHMTAIGTSLRYPDPDGAQPSGQTLIDAQEGAFLTIAHPNYASNNPWATISDEDIVALNGYHAIEICNTYCKKNKNDERKWEVALNAGKRVWGVAADDMHDYTMNPLRQGSSYCIVSADERTETAIIAALKAGNFYSTEGPTLALAGDDSTFTVVTGAAATITLRGPTGVLRSVTNSTEDTYAPPNEMVWVRVGITRNSDGKQAWSQPLCYEPNYRLRRNIKKSLNK